MTSIRVRSVDRFAHLLAAAALFALLAPTAGLLLDTQFAGWSSNHGHAGRVSALATHSHPYDDHHAVGADALDGRTRTNQATADEAADVTFTPADDLGPAAIALAREPASLPAAAAPTVAAPSLSSLPIGVGAELVPTPPPRA